MPRKQACGLHCASRRKARWLSEQTKLPSRSNTSSLRKMGRLFTPRATTRKAGTLRRTAHQCIRLRSKSRSPLSEWCISLCRSDQLQSSSGILRRSSKAPGSAKSAGRWFCSKSVQTSCWKALNSSNVRRQWRGSFMDFMRATFTPHGKSRRRYRPGFDMRYGILAIRQPKSAKESRRVRGTFPRETFRAFGRAQVVVSKALFLGVGRGPVLIRTIRRMHMDSIQHPCRL